MTRALVVAALAALAGCGAPARSWHLPARTYAPAAARPPRARTARSSARAAPAVALVERALHERGLRFGTDGTTGALYGYLRDHGTAVIAADARAGDVVFFDLGDGCAGHVGLVESVDGDRVAFREARDGQVRRSFADASAPLARRDAQGRVLNTFLRSKRPDDPPQARYFAGDMLCAVLRPRR